MTKNLDADSDATDSASLDAAVELNDVASGYGSSVVVRGVDLNVRKGQVLAVIGKNGMGKSTLLKTITGVIPARRGTVDILGRRWAKASAYRIARSGVGYVPQEQPIFADLSVERNILLAFRQKHSIDDVFDYIGELFPVLPSRRRQLAGTLSGGEQKMLILARALVTDPQVLLIDEITEGLQPSVRQRIAKALQSEISRQGMTVILVEQDLQFAFRLADRYVVMHLGRIVEHGLTIENNWEAVAERHLAI